MSDPNIFVSNGTCYSAAGRRLHESFIPCGNAAFGHHTCCGAGDFCLEENSCWGKHGEGYGSELTYMAGCTDPTYSDPSCPKKEFDQPWIALTRCDPPDDDEWAPCEQDGSPTTLQNGAFCSCTDAASTTIAFTIGTVIPNTASLPRSTGESIQFMAGHFPTSPPASGPSGSGTNPGGGSGSTGPTPTGSGSSSGGSGGTPSETDPAGSDGGDGGSSGSGMSQGTKIAIGVGVSVGVLVLLAALVALFILRRRRSRADGSVGSKSWKRASATSTAPTVPEADGKSVSEADGRAAAPWTMRSELEGRQVAAGPKAVNGEKPLTNGHSAGTGPRLDNVAELPGSEAWPSTGR